MKWVIMLTLAMSVTQTSFAKLNYSVSDEQIQELSLRLNNEADLLEQQATSETEREVARNLKLSAGILKKIDKEKIKVKCKKGGKKVLRGLGKTAAFITTHTLQPFAFVTGYFSGLFNKKKINEKEAWLVQVLFENRHVISVFMKDNRDLSSIELAELMEELLVTILSDEFEKQFKSDIDAMIADLVQLAQEEGMEAITVDKVNEHPRFQELKTLVGDLTKEQLDKLFDDLLEGNEINATNLIAIEEIFNFERMKYEGIGIAAAQILAPALTIGLITKSAGAGIGVGLVTLGADVATGLIGMSCLNKQMEEDLTEEELKFCGYIINRTVGHVGRSYVGGIARGLKHKKKIQEKRQKKRDQK
jgi:hypothetical protein